jgi:hypothetical protein
VDSPSPSCVAVCLRAHLSGFVDDVAGPDPVAF